MRILLAIFAVFVISVATAKAGDPPNFYSETYPKHALGPAMEWDKQLKGEQSPLDAKARELVSLAVAAQIPCTYCVYGHMRAAKIAGATDAEIKQAIAMAARVRHWSTVLNGMAYDFDKFKAEVDKLMPPPEMN